MSRTIRSSLHPSRGQHGFTLLEILLASVLMAILLTLAFSTVTGAVRTTRSGEAQIERTDSVRTTQEFLRRQISHIMPVAYEQLDDNGEIKMFEGRGDKLRFVAPMPGYLSHGGLHVQWLAITRGHDGMQLEFDHSQLNGYDPEDPKANNPRDPVVLLDGLAEAKFEYRGLDDQGEMEDWKDDWDEPAQLPLMVRLNLRFNESNRSWPLFEVPLKLARSTSNAGARMNRSLDRRLRRPQPNGREDGK